MKKAVFLMMLLIFPSVASYAQTGEEYFNDELSLSYGRASVPGIAMTLGAILGAAFTAGLARPDSYQASGAIGAEYYHYFNEHFAVGGDFIFESSRLSWEQYAGKDSDGNSIYRPGTSNTNYFLSLLPGVKWRYLSHPKFGMYTKAGFGGMMVYSPSYTTTETTTDPDTGNQNTDTIVHDAGRSFSYALQLTLLGMEGGERSVRWFTELGFGMQGLLSAGIRYRF